MRPTPLRPRRYVGEPAAQAFRAQLRTAPVLQHSDRSPIQELSPPATSSATEGSRLANASRATAQRMKPCCCSPYKAHRSEEAARAKAIRPGCQLFVPCLKNLPQKCV